MPSYSGVLERVTEYGQLVFQDGRRLRLWGLVPEPAFQHFMEGNLVGKTLECYTAGRTSNPAHFPKLQDNVAACVLELSPFIEDRNLVGKLLRAGAATEFCAESGNTYGTCD